VLRPLRYCQCRSAYGGPNWDLASYSVTGIFAGTATLVSVSFPPEAEASPASHSGDLGPERVQHD
jgi:hypothetical protein